MTKRPAEGDTAGRSKVARRKPTTYTMLSECPSVVFWVASYIPAGVMFTFILNSLAPLVIALCLGVLTDRWLN
jgi:hypothetical protein